MRDTNYNVVVRSSPDTNKSSKDTGNDFGNAPISSGESRKPTRSDKLLCSLFRRNEARSFKPAAREQPMQLIVVLFIERSVRKTGLSNRKFRFYSVLMEDLL